MINTKDFSLAKVEPGIQSRGQVSLDFEAWGDFRWLFCFGSPSLRLQLYILLFVAILIIIIICLDAVAVQNNYINCTFYRIVILLLALSLYHLVALSVHLLYIAKPRTSLDSKTWRICFYFSIFCTPTENRANSIQY